MGGFSMAKRRYTPFRDKRQLSHYIKYGSRRDTPTPRLAAGLGVRSKHGDMTASPTLPTCYR